MKRILHVVNRMGYGGIETFLMNLYQNIDRDKVQFDFAVHTKIPGEYDETIRKMGGKIYYFTSRRKNFLKYYKEWKYFLKENANKYNSIHMHVSSLTTITPIVIAKKYKIKNRIVHAHSTLQEGSMHKFLNKINQKRIKNYATKLLACSTVAGNYVFGNNDYEIIKNGVNLKRFKFNEEIRRKTREKFNIKNDEIAYINIGRLTAVKNQIYLLDVFKEIYDKEKSSKLFIIGKGELKDRIKEKVKELELERQVILLEARDDVAEILQGMDIFILPSLYEGLPIVAIEAQGTGIKCFISKNVTQEVKVTDLVDFIDINRDCKEIAKNILENREYERKNIESKKLLTYDIKNVAKYIVDKIYLK